MKKLTYHVWTIRELTLLKTLSNKIDITTKDAAKQLVVPHFAVKNACHKYGISFYRKSVFKKGMRPWNKGRKHDVGHGTRFKKGNLPHNTKHDGAIRIQPDKSGRNYKYIRIGKANWIPLHRYIWTQVYGDPGTNVIRFKDGDTMNCSIENLDMISRGENARLNTLIRKPRGKVKLIAY